jgi:hypothetical protein
MCHHASIRPRRKALRVQISRNKGLFGGVVSIRMPYRDDELALQAKKEQLEQDRARIEEQKRALAELADDEARVARELVDVERRLSKHKKSLPLLGEIRIASPCNADWKAMTGDEQTRFCDKCSKNVYNLSAMTTVQAEALIREKEGNVCVRYYQRADGTVMTTDCSVGLRRKRIKTVAFVAAVGAAAAGGVFALEESMVMGDMAESDTRMGKLEAVDFGHIHEVPIQATMGAITGPDDLSYREKNADEVVEGESSRAKPHTSVQSVPPKVPQRP